jgi:hypothetical protein
MFQTNRLLSYRVRWFTATVLTSTASFASQSGTVAGGDVDPKTGMTFPAPISSFKRQGPIEYDAGVIQRRRTYWDA